MQLNISWDTVKKTLLDAVRFLYAMLLSFLPLKVRKRMTRAIDLDPSSASFAAGIIMAFSGIAFFIKCFYLHISGYTDFVTTHVTSHEMFQKETVRAFRLMSHSGVIGYISFFFTPAGMITTYITITGLAKVFAYVTSRLSLGDPVIAGTYHTYSFLTSWQREKTKLKMAGPVLPDQFLPGGENVHWDLLVKSTRDKKDWRKTCPVKIGGSFYWMINRFEMIEPGSGLLRFCFHLKKLGEDELIRTFIDHRHPE